MGHKKLIPIALSLCLAGSVTGLAAVVYENDYEGEAVGGNLPAWNWGDNGTVHAAVYADYEGNVVVEHTGTMGNTTAAARSMRFGSKWDITLSGNTSSNPADYFIAFDLRSVAGNWDPIDLEFYVLTKEDGGDYGYGSGVSQYAQADGWVHVVANLADLSVNWWQGQDWDMTNPNWSIEVGGPPYPGTSVPAGTPAWDQIWLMDNLIITMGEEPPSPATEFATHPAPDDEATDVMRETNLTWTPGQYAASHDVYLGTSLDDVTNATRADPLGVLTKQAHDVNSFDPVGMFEFGTTYYWRVDEVNTPPSDTIFKGDVWSFTVEPYAYPIAPAAATASSSMNDTMGPARTIDSSGLDPDTDQHSIDITDMWVSSKTGPQPTWIQYEFDRVLKLDRMRVWNSNQALEEMLGYGVKQAKVEVSTDGTTWAKVPNVPEFSQATGLDTYVYNTTVDLGGAVARYVKLTCLGTWGGGNICSLSEVRFFSIPTQARRPQPESGAANVPVETPLTWRPGREAVRHEVYLGTDPNALVLAQTVTDHRVALTALGGQYGQTYYWQVNEVNDAALPQSWEGDVWTLSTPTYRVVDDFEAYNDECGRIFFSWSDGYGHSGSLDCGVAAASGNGTGSTVGKADAPYAERENVHSGVQAMPFSYDNTSGSGVSEAVLTFSPAQDWTLGGIRTLVLFFKGDPANGSGQVYVKINGTKVSYSGSAAALTTGLWNQWNVDLSGLSVQAVSSLTLGVSGTGKGDLYVDDIRLYGQPPAVDIPTDPGTGALAAYYAFEADAKDAAGKDYNGTLVNEPTFGDSKAGLGKALALDGVNDYVDLPIGSLISTLTSTTVSAWINFDTASTGSWVRLFDFGTSSTAGYMFLCPRQGTTGTMRFAITTGTNTGESGVNGPQTLTAGWHHVAVVIDGVAKTVQLVLDGEVVASGATAVVPKDLGVTTQNWLGQSQWSGDGYYQGLIDEFRIYNRVLTVGEVRYLAGDR